MLGACGEMLNNKPTHWTIPVNDSTQTPRGQSKQGTLDKGMPNKAI